MKSYDIRFPCLNSEDYDKWISAHVVQPDLIDDRTGAMLLNHGWGGNRFQYRDIQQDYCDRYNLVTICTEYRQSGFDFDPVTGLGAYRPYDFSHLQVFDCLIALRTVLDLLGRINRRRLFMFGGSQGGHIAALGTAFAPNTFALAQIVSAISYPAPEQRVWAGRTFSQDELDVRNALRLAKLVRNPFVIMHGTADQTVAEAHSRKLEQALRTAHVPVTARYYEGGDHGLAPVTTRHEATTELAGEMLRTLETDGRTDFDRESLVRVACTDLELRIDWSKAGNDLSLVRWIER